MATFDVGDVVHGKYEVTRVLGTGGMGVVVAARHRELGELVALKFPRPAIRDNAASCARFMREARTATRIKNEHVARVYDVDTDEGTPFIVMEYLTGHDLAAEIRQHGPLPVARAVDLLLQACEAVADAHKLGIVHRDLKPANLFLTTGSDGLPFIKVLDFGISKSLTGNEESVTASHAVVGSPLYMSPEQLAGSRHVDQRSDVWSLGVLLYEMLTAATPFSGESIATVGAAVFRGLYTRLSVHRPEAPEGLEQAVSGALMRDLEKRLASVQAFAAGIAPYGTPAGHASLERIERIAARAAVTEPPGPDATTPDGPPSAMERARRPSATTAVGATSQGTEVPPRPSRTRRTLVLGSVAAIALGAVVFVGMRLRARADSVGSGGATEQPSTANSACPVESADKGNQCNECRDANCCAQHLACRDSRPCGDYLACLRPCSDVACKNTCIETHSEGHAIAAPLLACVATRCAGACSSGSGVRGCSACQVANCSASENACLSDPACDALYACQSACGPRNDACAQTCKSAASPATQGRFNEFFFCGMTYCAEACK